MNPIRNELLDELKRLAKESIAKHPNDVEAIVRDLAAFVESRPEFADVATSGFVWQEVARTIAAEDQAKAS